MKILAIGNSFSQDATRYLHQIAQADGRELTVVNLYIGGCSLETHVANLRTEEKAYAYEFNGENTGKLVSISETLISDRWDVVTMQQVSRYSVNYDTFIPYIGVLSEEIHRLAPQAEQLIHQTWAYEQGSDRLNNELGYADQSQMFADLKAAYEKAATELGGLRIIPCGAAFQYALQSGISHLHRDTFHASLGVGRYILAGVWYQLLTGADIADNTFSSFDEPVEDSLVKTAKKCIQKAVNEYENHF